MKFSNIGRKLGAVGALSLAGVGSAFAVAPDTTAILASITDGQTAAIAVALAFGVAVWAVRGVKMIRRA